eukprot:scaffold5286_cov33-Tisochrysis_lutea.AAC.1
MAPASSSALSGTIASGSGALGSAAWASDGCEAGAPVGSLELVLATHTALLSYNVQTQCWRRISEGRGHYYGVVPVDAASAVGPRSGALLVGSQGKLSRPRKAAHAAKFAGAAPRNESSGLPGLSDAVLLLNPNARSVIGWWALPTSYLHDMIFDPESRTLFALDSDAGSTLQLSLEMTSQLGPGNGFLSLPYGAGQVRLHARQIYDSVGGRRGIAKLFRGVRAHAAHVNNAAVALGHVWVMHNNLASTSSIELVDLTTGEKRGGLPLGGPNCHNPCFYRGRLLYLLSSSGGLGRLHPNGTSETLFAAGKGWFSKGLAVVDHVAYFGLAPKQRSSVERNWAEAQLAAFSLRTGTMQWRRSLPFRGLINSVTAPNVDPSCSWRACDMSSTGAGAAEHLPKEMEWRRVVNW